MSRIGDRLRDIREDKMLSQIQVYKDTGIHNKTLSGYERGVSQPDLETISLLARYYGVSIDYLISEKNIDQNINYYTAKEIPLSQALENSDIYEVIEDILSLSTENQKEISKLIGLYKIKEEYEKMTRFR